jgi:hypothetical protein
MGTDAIDAAVAAVEAAPEEVAQPMVQIPVKIASTGRLVIVMVPPDLTEAEALEWVSWFTGQVVPQLRAKAEPAGPRLVVASRLPS